MVQALLSVLFLMMTGAAHGPPDEMFDRLQAAPSDEEAEGVALDIWNAWLESGSPTVDILMERAVEAQTTGDPRRARILYDRIISLRPEYAEAWHRRATLFLAEERFDEALRDLNEALRHEPRHFGAWLGLAVMMEKLGSTDEALAAYREALAIYPRLIAARRAEARLRRRTEGTSL